MERVNQLYRFSLSIQLSNQPVACSLPWNLAIVYPSKSEELPAMGTELCEGTVQQRESYPFWKYFFPLPL